MKKIVLILACFMAVFFACKNNNKQESPIDKGFVFEYGDTCVDTFVYASYIPIEYIDKSKIVMANYVRYHDGDSTAIVFSRNYIRNLCLHSSCVGKNSVDPKYGNVMEIYFPEADLGFAYDKWEEMIVYSFINFDGEFWYSDITEDGITVTSDIKTTLWEFLPYCLDQVESRVNIYTYDENGALSVDHVKIVPFKMWDLMRSFELFPIEEGIKRDSIIIYKNEPGLTFVRSIGDNGWNHLQSVYFGSYVFDDPESLKQLEQVFMSKLKKISVRDDIFIPYEPE